MMSIKNTLDAIAKAKNEAKLLGVEIFEKVAPSGQKRTLCEYDDLLASIRQVSNDCFTTTYCKGPNVIGSDYSETLSIAIEKASAAITNGEAMLEKAKQHYEELVENYENAKFNVMEIEGQMSRLLKAFPRIQ